MRRKRTAGTVLALLCCLAAGAGADVKGRLTEQGGKARIAVGEIATKTDQCDAGMAQAVAEMLSTALAGSDRFIVLASRAEVDQLAGEIELGEAGMVEEGRAAERGLMEGADVLITGAVTAFEPQAGAKSGVLSGLKTAVEGQVGMSSSTAEIVIDLKLIDVRTRRILKAIPVEARSTSWSTEASGSGAVGELVMAGGLSGYSNTPMEKAVRAALVDAVKRIEKEMPKEYYRYEGKGQYSTRYGKDDPEPVGGGAASAAAVSPATADMSLLTKYDFVPGDKVIFWDDMAGDEAGEFPRRWDLVDGVFEVARKGGEPWILCTDGGAIRPRVKVAPLPDKYTVELEIWDNGSEYSGHYFNLAWVGEDGDPIGRLFLGNSLTTRIDIRDEEKSNKDLPARLSPGRHVMRIMATRSTIKCYVDQERVGNIPRMDGWAPFGFRIECDPYTDDGNPMLLRGFRFAEGGKSLRDQLDEAGRIVTHGILFDIGSDVIRAESYRTLADIAQLLRDDPELRLSIEGHTDSDGADDANQALSGRRAASVRDWLTGQGISAGRLETKGWGEAQPVDTNGTPEGRANNRRVELAKL
jgi:outer membrane protein OmpA-like peptidoglycan-associated protein/curli biogenesis system outer membrane secretion channel CsgG